MARSYGATGSDTNSTTTTPWMLCQPTTALTRLVVYDLLIGSSAAPNDYSVKYEFKRSSTDGTGGTTPTPAPHDPINPAAAGVFRYNGTEPTYGTVIPLTISKNMRSTVRWLPLDMLHAIIIPQTNSNGLGGYATNATTGYAEEGCWSWEE